VIDMSLTISRVPWDEIDSEGSRGSERFLFRFLLSMPCCISPNEACLLVSLATMNSAASKSDLPMLVSQLISFGTCHRTI
jgi:hypothetical protein